MSCNQFDSGFSKLNSDPLLNKSDNRDSSLLEVQPIKASNPVAGNFPQVIVLKPEATEATLKVLPICARAVEPSQDKSEKKGRKVDKDPSNFPELTGLRALAIFIVYAIHCVSFPHKLNGNVKIMNHFSLPQEPLKCKD